MRALLIALGVVMVATGGVWTAQGLGYLEGSPMTDQSIWAIIGPILAGFGVALVIVAARRRE
jgi:drug/metabolite transporter superfamily protein YnfA